MDNVTFALAMKRSAILPGTWGTWVNDLKCHFFRRSPVERNEGPSGTVLAQVFRAPAVQMGRCMTVLERGLDLPARFPLSDVMRDATSLGDMGIPKSTEALVLQPRTSFREIGIEVSNTIFPVVAASPGTSREVSGSESTLSSHR